MKFLIEESVRRGSKEFDIPYDRQALADYLCVDRSVLSSEISKLIDKRVIESRKNHFKLLFAASDKVCYNFHNTQTQ